MIILDKPYVSVFLKDTILDMKLPVLRNETTDNLELNKNIDILEEDEFISRLKNQDKYQIYSNSENSIDWMVRNLDFTGLPENICLFKNKLRFRKLLENIFPDFYYRGVEFSKLDELNVEDITKPFVIKPSIGFFSMGVHRVSSNEEWSSVLKSIKIEMEEVRNLYPDQVLNSNEFIIEEKIEGEEFAADIYYNNKGKPVILNIFKHVFASEKDVSDRLYITSKEIIENYRQIFLDFLDMLGALCNLKNFPMHVEIKLDKNNRAVPVEINPMRFAGWCTTDLAYYAYGINIYKYFYGQLEPDWDAILKNKSERIFSFIIANKPEDVDTKDIEMFDYEKFLSDFDNPLDLRKIDYKEYPVFGILFTETQKGNWNEIERILHSSLKEYIKLNCT